MKQNSLIRLTVFAVALSALGQFVQAGILKASPAQSTPFLEHAKEMKSDPGRTPFDKVWRNPSAQAIARVQDFDRIVILPVNTRYLAMYPSQKAEVEKMAAYMREQFQTQFAKGGNYHVMMKPGPKTLQLELALVELKPTNVAGNVLFTGVGVFAPGANIVGSSLTHGSIAFEAKLRNAETGELIAEYADREFDKLSPLSFRDYSNNAHSRRAVRDWAQQMERLASTPSSQKVSGAYRLTFNPF